MKSSTSIVVGVVCALALAGPAGAQTLEPGRWTGTISPPSGGTFDIWYEIAGAGDSLAATMFIPRPDGATAIPLDDLGFDPEGSLTFSYRGGEILCRLSLVRSAGYAGECTSETRPGSARLTMTQPVGRGE